MYSCRKGNDYHPCNSNILHFPQVIIYLFLNIFLSDPTKYFGCELGAQTQIDLKNERYIVNGSHDAEKLQEILDGFIEKFVLCPDCENPETVLVRIVCLLVPFCHFLHGQE